MSSFKKKVVSGVERLQVTQGNEVCVGGGVGQVSAGGDPVKRCAKKSRYLRYTGVKLRKEKEYRIAEIRAKKKHENKTEEKSKQNRIRVYKTYKKKSRQAGKASRHTYALLFLFVFLLCMKGFFTKALLLLRCRSFFCDFFPFFLNFLPFNPFFCLFGRRET